MKKLTVLLIVIVVTPIIAGIYGIIHDQITYSISHEYFTKFKFQQFHLATPGNEAILPNPRLAVLKVGFLATWWVGLLIGVGQGITGFIHKNQQLMRKSVSKAIIITLITTLIFGFAGYIYGKFFMNTIPEFWFKPKDLVDKENFRFVGSIHNFGYLGGLTGLISGMVSQTYDAHKNRRMRLSK